MSIALVVTRGFGNGTLVGDVNDIVTRGYSIATVAITGTLDVTLESAFSTATGNIQLHFDVNVLDINETIPLATEDPEEQQRIIIENIILIKQLLQNLLDP